MKLTIHDFPIKVQNNFLLNNKNEVVLDFNTISKEDLIQFILENISAINDGRRIYKKRLTKTLSEYSVEDAIDIIKTEMFNKGYIESEGVSDIEYSIICKYGKIKINFNKILIDMDNIDISKTLQDLLIKLLDAKTKKNLNVKNREIALKDLIKLLGLYWEKACKNKEEIKLKGFLNKHQEIWCKAINEAYSKVKYPLLNVNSNLWKYYIITLFGSIGKEDVLYELTNWKISMIQEERNLTNDMGIIMLSINKIFRDKENGEGK